MSDLETTTPVETRPSDPLLDDGDHDRFSHYARKSDIVKSTVTGRPIVSLCGKVWVPGRDPEKFPVCPECKDVWEKFRGDGDDDQGDEE